MTHSPAEILQSYFVGLALGTLGLQQYNAPPGNWPIFCSYMPPEGPEQAVCVYDTAPVSDGRVMPTGKGVYHPGIQVMVRAQRWDTTYDKAMAFHAALQALLNAVVVVGDATYNLLNAAEIKLPIRVGQEIGKDRMLCSLNALVTIQEFNQ